MESSNPSPDVSSWSGKGSHLALVGRRSTTLSGCCVTEEDAEELDKALVQENRERAALEMHAGQHPMYGASKLPQCEGACHLVNDSAIKVTWPDHPTWRRSTPKS